MSKALLVIDMPEHCKECSLHCFTFGCRIEMKRHDNFNNSRPDWCPLVPMPEKKDYNSAMEENVEE